MKKRSTKVTQQLEAVTDAMNRLEKGASVREIKDAMRVDIELRTLQRRIAELKEQGFGENVAPEKRAAMYRYALFFSEPDLMVVNEDAPDYGKQLRLSKAGEEIMAYLALPQEQRKRVGYKREFLQQYRPNVDSYLTLEEMKQLAEIGRTNREGLPAGSHAKEIFNRLLIDLSWNSSRLEGNTYSFLETERLLTLGKEADDKSTTEGLMILNHKEAIELLVDGASDNALDRRTIFALHAMLSSKLLDKSKSSGKLRSLIIGIGQSVYQPLATPQVLEELFNLMLEKASQIENPFEQAFFMLVHLPYLQPFEDVNKRTARLAANIPLIRANVCPISFTHVNKDVYTKAMLGIYELNRVDLLKDLFIWAYEKSAFKYSDIYHVTGKPDPFHLVYRKQSREVIKEVILQALGQEKAIAFIRDYAAAIPLEDRGKFIENAERDLMDLHDGNFVIYKVTLSQYMKWKEIWDLR